MEKKNVRILTTYPPTKCGIGTFSRDLYEALTPMKKIFINHIDITAIDKDKNSYEEPVDSIIQKYNERSWEKAKNQITKGRGILMLQHEYGLDPLIKNGIIKDCVGNHYVEIAKKANKNPNLITLAYLHTVLEKEKATQHQIKTIKDLGDYTDGLIVTTKSAIETLSSAPYNIPKDKLKHIDHGIRINTGDRLEIKERLGLENIFLATQLGLRSPDKGVQYLIPGVSEFVYSALTKKQREKFTTLIAGVIHPEFVKADNGKHFEHYQKLMNKVMKESNLRIQTTKNIKNADFQKNDIVIYDNFLSERLLKDLYCATNCMILPYLNMSQISSGILADTLGSGRIAISTKFNYAKEMLNLKENKKGAIVTDRGILIDSHNSKQIAGALNYLVFAKSDANVPVRFSMESNAYQRGHEMRWDNVAWDTLQYIKLIEAKRKKKTGRGVKFAKRKKSNLEDIVEIQN